MEETREIDLGEPAQTEAVTRSYPSVAAVEQLQTTTHDPFQGRRQAAYRLVQAIYLLFGSVDALIAIRIVLRLLGANPSASFAELIYATTDWLVAPFAGLFSTLKLEGGVLDVNALVALIVYTLLAWLLGRIACLAVGETRTGLVAHRRVVQTHVK